MSEEWRDIPGYEGRYQVSDLGRVRSLDALVRCGFEGKGQRLVVGRVLRPGTIDRWGHVSVALGKGNSQGVHVLVARAFIGPRPEGLDVAHWSSIGDDNRWANLIYTTRGENNAHRIPNGKAKITEADVVRLKGAEDRPASLALADELHISGSYANNIRLGHKL